MGMENKVKEPIITDLCEIDLSPGQVTVPCKLFDLFEDAFTIFVFCFLFQLVIL